MQEGDAAPDFEAKTHDGETVSLSGLRGAPVLVNFTATWCGPCQRELPDLISTYEKFKDRGLRVISIYLDTADKDVFAYAAELGANWPIHMDGRGWENEVARTYGVTGVPTNVLIGADGEILSTNLRRAGRNEAIEAALGGGAP